MTSELAALAVSPQRPLEQDSHGAVAEDSHTYSFPALSPFVVEGRGRHGGCRGRRRCFELGKSHDQVLPARHRTIVLRNACRLSSESTNALNAAHNIRGSLKAHPLGVTPGLGRTIISSPRTGSTPLLSIQ